MHINAQLIHLWPKIADWPVFGENISLSRKSTTIISSPLCLGNVAESEAVTGLIYY